MTKRSEFGSGPRNWVARLATTSMVLMAPAAAGLSSEAFFKLVEEVEQAESLEGDCARVLRVLARSGHRAVRAVTAELAGSLLPERRDEALSLLRELSLDEFELVRSASALGLARAIRGATPVERIELACDWSLSENWQQRAALARALAWPTPVFVTDLLIEQLAGDEHAEVRALALQAAITHLQTSPASYRTIAERLLSDPHELVRDSARAVLERV